ncbi:MAG: hypothetical protein IJR95_07130 [Lachnospiraceae bacterium]|nr:hypothetical protein [Lachnospiraceae bacterium]
MYLFDSLLISIVVAMIIGFPQIVKKDDPYQKKVIIMLVLCATLLCVCLLAYLFSWDSHILKIHSTTPPTNDNHEHISANNSAQISTEQFLLATEDCTELESTSSIIHTDETNSSNSIEQDLYRYNTDSLSIMVEELVAVVHMETEDTEEIGIIPQDNASILVRLMEYPSNNEFERRIVTWGEKVVFRNIPNGTYYLSITCESYKPRALVEPFVLQIDDAKPMSTLSWLICLERDNLSFGNQYQIRVLSSDLKPIPNTDFHVRAVEINNPNPNAFSVKQFTSDQNGFITFWTNTNGVDYYHEAFFSQSDGIVLEISRPDGTFQQIPIVDQTIIDVVIE